ncbi:hypothetical protein FRC12_001561 [Ceratobasidium sp. 428]|nr:hypothetical protein FRC12_001561 [Ceratobasidium sp. 428]
MPGRTARPLSIPPSLSPLTSPGLTSTSMLRLPHKESHSALGQSRKTGARLESVVDQVQEYTLTRARSHPVHL